VNYDDRRGVTVIGDWPGQDVTGQWRLRLNTFFTTAGQHHLPTALKQQRAITLTTQLSDGIHGLDDLGG